METRILKRISKNVQFRISKSESGKPEYIVERRSSISGEWEIIARTARIERALIKKHNVWIAQLHFMNLTGMLLNRRKFGKKKFLGFKIN